MNKCHKVFLYTSDIQTLRTLVAKELAAIQDYISRWTTPSPNQHATMAANHLESLLADLSTAEECE